MKEVYLIIFFIFGTLMGSFLTVVGLRLPKGENFINKRSHCDNCGHELHLYEMIPIFSYIIQKGRCRYCHKKIDIVALYMEFFTGVLFCVAYYSFGLSLNLLIALGIVSLLMIVTVSDLTYLIIPDEVLIFFGVYFLVIQFFNLGLSGLMAKIISAVFLFGIMYLIMFIGNKAFKKESLGGGDIKMMAVFGLVLDPILGVLTIFVGSIIALPVSYFLLTKNKEKVIPFGPFLLIAFNLIYFTKITPDMIINWLKF